MLEFTSLCFLLGTLSRHAACVELWLLIANVRLSSTGRIPCFGNEMWLLSRKLDPDWFLLGRYNFMPLCRGTAVVGYITLLGLFLAAGMEVTASIPQGLQVRGSPLLSILSRGSRRVVAVRGLLLVCPHS